MICTRCHRPLKHASITGMGRVCSAKAGAVVVPDHERDLFGYSVDKAVAAASYRLQVHIDSMAAEHSMALKASFREALARIRAGQPVMWVAPFERSELELELMDIMEYAKRAAYEACGIPPTAAPSANWGTSLVATPEYLAEQARRTTEYREALVRMELPDPAAEPNPIAAAFTRLMTWSQR